MAEGYARDRRGATLIEAAALLGLGALAALGVWRFRWLSPGGGAAAVLVGAGVLAGAGVAGLGLLLFFFVSSSLLTGFHAAAKRAVAVARADRTGRSAGQVLANGGVAAAAALLGLAGWAAPAQLALVGSLAAATADTWATEIGTAGRWPTRRIVGWRRVSPGTSGGVSLPGSLAAVAGASLCGVCAALWFEGPSGPLLRAGLCGGVLGTLSDSILGAVLEGRVEWVTNDAVNLAGTLVGAAAGWGAATWLGG